MEKTTKMKFGRTKAIDQESKTITALVSTYTWDRMSERIAKGAWDFASYLTNPVVLWAHDQWSAPVAKCVSVSEDQDGVIGVSAFDSASEDAMKIFDLYVRGFLSAFSVGFIPKKWELEPLMEGSQQKGIVYTQTELLEYSCVPVPANPGAIVTGKDAEDIIRVMGETWLNAIEIGQEKCYTFPIGPNRINPKKRIMDEPTIIKPDFAQSAQYILELSKAALAQAKAGHSIDQQHIALMKNLMEIFGELIPSDSKEMSLEDMTALHNSVAKLGMIASKMAGVPDTTEILARMNKSLDKVLKVVRAE